MAGIMNNTARQFNLKCISGGSRVVIRIAPGFNVVNDEHWEAFVPKKGKADPYVLELKKAGSISYGKEIDDLELERDPDTISKSKAEPLVKLKEQLKESEKGKVAAEAETEKAQAEAREATAKAEKAELELAELRKKAGATEADSKDDKSEETKDKDDKKP